MKNILAILAIVICTSVSLAQNIKKNTYILEGDLIEATLFHDNGTIAQTGYYTQENKLQGEWVSYDRYGNKTAVAEYNNGKKVGTWTFFQGDNTQQVVTYDNSRIAEVRTWKVVDTHVVSNTP